jgi:quinol monooxygenase YgiN
MNVSLNVLEFRDYLLTPDSREHFIDYFETSFISALGALDIHVLGQFRLVGKPDHFVWLRGFANMEVRKRGLESFYTEAFWKQRGATMNSMILNIDNMHLLRPLLEVDLLRGNSAERMAAALKAGALSVETGVVVIDFYHALAGKRDDVYTAFQTQVTPAYAAEDIQLRGIYAAEMRENNYPRLPAIQDADELVVISAYKSEASAHAQRAAVARQVAAALDGLLAAPTETMLLQPTLLSPLRWMAD